MLQSTSRAFNIFTRSEKKKLENSVRHHTEYIRIDPPRTFLCQKIVSIDFTSFVVKMLHHFANPYIGRQILWRAAAEALCLRLRGLSNVQIMQTSSEKRTQIRLNST